MLEMERDKKAKKARKANMDSALAIMLGLHEPLVDDEMDSVVADSEEEGENAD
jgi:hypothetical protein